MPTTRDGHAAGWHALGDAMAQQAREQRYRQVMAEAERSKQFLPEPPPTDLKPDDPQHELESPNQYFDRISKEK